MQMILNPKSAPRQGEGPGDAPVVSGRLPALLLVPCLSGAPWSPEQRAALAPFPTRTLRLNEVHGTIERHADDVLEAASGLGRYVLVGDSFGAQVALACAIRRPEGLLGLVMSGGFAANPIDRLSVRLKAFAAGLMPGVLYRDIVVPMHARLLASPCDSEGDLPWTIADSIRLFRENTTWTGYVNRVRASLEADYRPSLGQIDVPTLLITPEDDRLIGRDAAQCMLDGIPGAEEVMLARSGHMLRFSHPLAYAELVRRFLARRLGIVAAAPVAGTERAPDMGPIGRNAAARAADRGS